MSRNDKNWKNKITRDEDFDFNVIREGRNIEVADVMIGDHIITGWTRSGRVATTSQVKEFMPCPGNNGMHVHINRTNCYDSRAMVWVK